MKSLLLCLLTLFLFFTRAAVADPYQAVITGWDGCNFEPLETFAEWVPHDHLTDGAAAAAAAPGGRVFGAMRTGAGVHVAELLMGEPALPVSQTVPNYLPLGLSVSAAGRMYVLAQPLPSGPDVILTFDALGNAGPVHVLGEGFATPPASPLGAMDLAADQCTLFLLQNNGVIRRFNVCIGSFLPDFAVANPASSSLRILPDGGLLVGRDGATDRYTAGGALVRTYPQQGSGAIGLVQNGLRAWIAPRCGSHLIELDLATGATTEVAEPTRLQFLSIVPYRGWSAALGAHLGESIPTMTEAGIAALCILVGFAAVLRLR